MNKTASHRAGEEEGNLSARPVLWIRKGNYREFALSRNRREALRLSPVNVERLEKDEILAIPEMIFTMTDSSG
jgi:hypothetical protein